MKKQLAVVFLSSMAVGFYQGESCKLNGKFHAPDAQNDNYNTLMCDSEYQEIKNFDACLKLANKLLHKSEKVTNFEGYSWIEKVKKVNFKYKDDHRVISGSIKHKRGVHDN